MLYTLSRKNLTACKISAIVHSEMNATYTISAAAKIIGCSRPTLYGYLSRVEYRPTKVAGFPTLSAAQVKAIKKERDAKNGAKK